jgi:NitT/TauT family transport system substrate-binding protein
MVRAFGTIGKRMILALTWAALIATAPALAMDKIVEAHIPGSFMSLPVYVAYDQGIYKKHGLDVELANITSGPDTVAAVLSGSVTFMLNSGDNLMRAMDNGSPPLKIVVGNLGQMPFTLIARKDMPAPNKTKGYPDVMKDLKGKTVGVVARGGSVDFIMRAMLRDGGLDPDKDVKWVAVGTAPTAVPAMQNGQIDAYLAFEPFQTIAMTQLGIGQVLVDLRKGEGPRQFRDFPYNFYSGRADWIESHPDIVERYVAAMAESHAFIKAKANENAVFQTAMKYMKMDPALLKQMLADNAPTLSPYVANAGLQQWIDFARNAQGVKTAFTVDGLLATQFVPKRER